MRKFVQKIMPKFGAFSKSMSPPLITTKAKKQFTANGEKKEEYAKNKSKTKNFFSKIEQ